MVETEKHGRRRRTGKRLLLVVAGLLLVPVVFEVGFRLTQFSPLITRHPCSPGANHPQYLFIEDPTTSYALRPYFEGEDENPYGDFIAPVIVNSDGLRDRSVKPEQCSDCRYLIMLGPSQTYGEGVTYDQTYSKLLEEAFQRDLSPSLRVLNAGVPGYSLRQSFLRLQHYFDRYQPKMAVVFWSPVSFSRESYWYLVRNGYLLMPEQKDHVYAVRNNLFRSLAPPGSARLRTDLWLQSHSFFYYWVKNKLMSGYTARLIGGRLVNPGSFEVPALYLVQPMKTITAMRDYCQERGASFGLVVYFSTPATTKLISEYCRQQGLPIISVAEQALDPKSPYQKLLFEHDNHFNADGHAYLAAEMRPFIIQTLSAPAPAPGPSPGAEN